jgi:hypothetical protein
MREDDSFAEQVADWGRRKASAAPKKRAKPGDVSTFCYDLLIIVAGLAGVIILLRLFAEAVSG